MAVQIRAARLDSDRGALIDLLGRYLTSRSDERRLRWLYCDGTFGAAKAWVACNENGTIIGASAAFPRKFYFDGNEKVGFVLGDFCMEEKYRSLGPSLQMQRACLAMLEEPGVNFLYDFPSLSMMAVYRRLGFMPTGELVRWAKPVRVEHRLESVIHSKRLAQEVGKVMNFALAHRGWKGVRSTCEIERHEGSCGEEFDQLNEQLRHRKGMQSVHSAAYLNWRYVTNPLSHHHILTARRNGKLLGYVVSAKTANEASIVDLQSIEQNDVIARLLTRTVDHLKSLGAATVSLAAVDSHPWNSLFQRAGFQRRETSPVVVCMRSSETPRERKFWSSWYAMASERDS